MVRDYVSAIPDWAMKTRRRATLKNLSKRGRRAVAALFTMMAVAAGAASSWDTIRERAVRLLGTDDPTLIVLHSRLIPYFAAFPDSPQRDQFSLQFELRNYGASPVILTSAEIAMAQSSKAKIGPGGSTPSEGGCTLSARPTDNEPIEMAPGASIWLEISPMVNLPGLRKWLDSDALKNVHVVQEFPLTIHELTVVDKLNAELSRSFGRNAEILVSLYTGIHQRRRNLTFPLTKGKDVFSADGSLMHDALISYWLSPTSKAAMLGCRDHVK